MKKTAALLLALVLALAMLPAAAEEDVFLRYLGVWSDPNFDRMELLILPDYAAWTDDRMGEALNGLYYIEMNWASSESEYTNYRMVAALDGAAGTLTYSNGLMVDIEVPDSGEQEVTLQEENGEGVFTLQADGTLRWQDSCVESAAEMVLTAEKHEVPSAEELADGFYRVVAGLETDTAGASLKQAEAVVALYRFCLRNTFWDVDSDALAQNMYAALELLSEEERQAYDEKEADFTNEAFRLTEENQEPGSAYADAGLEEDITALRSDVSVRYSVQSFISYIATLENYGED